MIDLNGRRFGLGLLLGAVVVLSGCDQLGSPIDVLQGNAAKPDEFEVISRKPLRMPSSVRIQDLPEPRLGERSPLEPNPNADAAQALLGAGATGGAGGTSSSEAALVGAARDAVGDGAPVTQEQIDDLEPNELPTISVLIGLSEGEKKTRDALNADAEARRLQTEGRSAPVNPNAESAEDG